MRTVTKIPMFLDGKSTATRGGRSTGAGLVLALFALVIGGCEEPETKLATAEPHVPPLTRRQIEGTPTKAAVLARLKELGPIAADAKNLADGELGYLPGAASLSSAVKEEPSLPAVRFTRHLPNAADYGDVVAYTPMFVKDGRRVGANDSTTFDYSGKYVLVHADGRLREVDPKDVRLKKARLVNPIFPGCPGYDPTLDPLPGIEKPPRPL